MLPALLAAALLVGGCAKQRAPATSGSPTLPSDRVSDPALKRVLDAALSMQGSSRVRVDGRTFRADCSGFVIACWHAANRELIDPGAKGRSGTALIFDSLRKRGRLVAKGAARGGDLVFFHNTYDRNRNGVRDDTFTHVALVEYVDPDGTVHYMHFASGKVKRGVFNPKHPDTARDPDHGKAWNSFLRRGGGKVLAGQLVHRIGRP